MALFLAHMVRHLGVLRRFAVLREKMGDFDSARAFWREARELYESLGIEAGAAEASKALAQLGVWIRNQAGGFRADQMPVCSSKSIELGRVSVVHGNDKL